MLAHRPLFGVAIAFAVAAYLYPHLLPWFVLAAFAIGAAQTALLVLIWRRLGPRLRSSGFRW